MAETINSLKEEKAKLLRLLSQAQTQVRELREELIVSLGIQADLHDEIRQLIDDKQSRLRKEEKSNRDAD